MLAEIRRCYEELDKFWADEIRRAVKALEMRRVDLKDFERWKDFHTSIKKAIEDSKVWQCTSLMRSRMKRNTLFRLDHQAVILKSYAAKTHNLQLFVYSSYRFGVLWG